MILLCSSIAIGAVVPDLGPRSPFNKRSRVLIAMTLRDEVVVRFKD